MLGFCRGALTNYARRLGISRCIEPFNLAVDEASLLYRGPFFSLPLFHVRVDVDGFLEALCVPIAHGETVRTADRSGRKA